MPSSDDGGDSMRADEDGPDSVVVAAPTGVDAEWLLRELRSDSGRCVLIDCRSSVEFGEAHIRHAVNLSIPSIMLRRLAAGKIDLVSTIKCRELKAKIADALGHNVFVVYGDSADANHPNYNDTLEILTRRLKQDGCRVACLNGGFGEFKARYPEWCESDAADVAAPLMGLRSLRISSSSSSASSSSGGGSSDVDDADRCDSSLGLDEDREFPVEIVPFLFLGNAVNSEDIEALQRHRIQYIMNVTPDLPNVFEDSGNIRYMQIPIADHWNQNLACFFPKAIEFIDEARNSQKGVLVHCLAGVSRSVTITVAYLMYKMHLSLNDAFNVVRNRKSNIAPNFNFMEQLHSFEQELRLRGEFAPAHTPLLSIQPPEVAALRGQGPMTRRCPCGRPDCTCQPQNSQFLSPLLPTGASPDSGIEFDRWASTANE
ncbi:dual specificity protein phosphatase Mpk3-like [Neocloeon triangulifer]|uniref:dual specificity protein phosphatase Mpk3-like n=1 Tax=Neocloeon triangulifer TaxID=2078957 RepID=UPI00286FAE8D|nr:dual specificity protein phosphatase Mpk3-like [Neocloeon triangulifer]